LGFLWSENWKERKIKKIIFLLFYSVRPHISLHLRMPKPGMKSLCTPNVEPPCQASLLFLDKVCKEGDRSFLLWIIKPVMQYNLYSKPSI